MATADDSAKSTKDKITAAMEAAWKKSLDNQSFRDLMFAQPRECKMVFEIAFECGVEFCRDRIKAMLEGSRN